MENLPLIIFIALLLIAAVLCSWMAFVTPDNPHPQRPGFTQVWNTLTPWQKRKFRWNVSSYASRSDMPVEIHINPLKRVYTLLYRADNLVDGCFIRKDPLTNKNICYFTPSAALQTVNEFHTNTSIVKTPKELEKLLRYIPGANDTEKLWNLVCLFELTEYGSFNSLGGYHDADANKLPCIYVMIADATDYRKLSYDMRHKEASLPSSENIPFALPVLVRR